MKPYLTILFISLTSISINAQIPLSEIIGILELSLPKDSTSMYIGKRDLNAPQYSIEDRMHNVIMGFRAANAPEEGSSSVIIGHEAAEKANEFDHVVVIGDHAAQDAIAIEESTIIGRSAGGTSEFIHESIAIGDAAGYNVDTISESILIGYETGKSSTHQIDNIAIGNEALYGSSGRENSYFGNSAGYRNSGNYNLGCGIGAGDRQVGDNNTYLGTVTGFLSKGNGNMSTGYKAGRSTNGNKNISIGYEAGNNITGNNNIYIGEGAGNDIVGSQNIILGQYSSDSAPISGQFIISDSSSNETVRIDRNREFAKIYTQDFLVSTSPPASSISYLQYKDRMLRNVGNTVSTPGIGLFESVFGEEHGFNFEFNALQNKLNLKTEGWNGYEGTRMTWLRDGKVGINITDPQELLHVAGDSRIDGEQEVESLIVKGTTGEFGIISSSPTMNNSDLLLQANDDIVLELDNNGGSASSFSVKNGANATILELLENGNLSVDGTLVHTSDINRKYDIIPVNHNDILEKIQDLNIATWKYNGTEETHIGPMAQDFYAAFGLGGSDTTIATVDADGVALAAIKALADNQAQLKKENQDMRSLIQQLSLQIQRQDHRLKQLEQQ